MTATGRIKTLAGSPLRRSTGYSLGLGPATSHHWPPNPDSSPPGETVCYWLACQIGRIDPASCRLLLLPPCYSMFRVVSGS